ncbi:MAG TPA: right-handed parallel beta-helix repeat-containing protein [Bryobacteraceae bacterium]|nr:right-handed parallel beta-helix repeat-containing protein [Bryobacteraceae bacterium]
MQSPCQTSVHTIQKKQGFRSGIAFSALSLALIAGTCRPASAATSCVAPGGAGNCYPSITAALGGASANDVIQVAAGTYKESVLIKIPITLLGAGANVTFIDATGMANGIYVDGFDNAGLSNVTIRNFTVENANFEGILVTNASSVSISQNHVTNNTKSLNPTAATCIGLPAFETSESMDCGEGIHLMAVDHSIIANNLVDFNSGGILSSDETGATHDNLITGNTVTGNPYACGITLASHPPAANIIGPSPGIYRVTIAGNTSIYNGLGLPGAGAGVGIFDPIPGTKNYSHVVINNTLIGNGLPGVTMHSHAPGQVMMDILIAGNTISGNAADTQDAATPGPTGINVLGVSPITGLVITNNFITDEAVSVAIKTGANVQIHLNNFDENGIGIDNLGSGTIMATQNWWGCAGGPGTTGCSTVSGTGVTSTAPLARQIIPQ